MCKFSPAAPSCCQEAENKLVLILCLKESGSLIKEFDTHSLFTSELFIPKGTDEFANACIAFPTLSLGERQRKLFTLCALAGISGVTTGLLA